jgi:hypothetical protein
MSRAIRWSSDGGGHWARVIARGADAKATFSAIPDRFRGPLSPAAIAVEPHRGRAVGIQIHRVEVPIARTGSTGSFCEDHDQTRF